MLRHRALRRVPEVIALCDAVTDVDLSDNAISSVPALLHWHALVACTLSNNVLVELPAELPLPLGHGSFDQLRHLNLSGNMLNSSVRHVTWLWRLTSLAHLDISLNPLSCDVNLECLKSLQHCCIRQTLITNCPAGLPFTLTHLDLSHNQLRELPGNVQCNRMVVDGVYVFVSNLAGMSLVRLCVNVNRVYRCAGSAATAHVVGCQFQFAAKSARFPFRLPSAAP